MEVGSLPNHVNSSVLCVCLLFNFCLFTIFDLSPGVLLAQHVCVCVCVCVCACVCVYVRISYLITLEKKFITVIDDSEIVEFFVCVDG